MAGSCPSRASASSATSSRSGSAPNTDPGPGQDAGGPDREPVTSAAAGSCRGTAWLRSSTAHQVRSAPSFPPFRARTVALLSKPETAKLRSWGETAQDNREPGKLTLPGPQLGRLRGGYRLLVLVLRLLRRLGGLAKLNIRAS